MSANPVTGHRYRFEDFELDVRNARISRGGRALRIRPQAFKILTLLVERSGELVTREEIRTQIWSADTFVDFNQGLNAGVKQIRAALGDDAESPRFVETIPRLGYRFIARVEAERIAPQLQGGVVRRTSRPAAGWYVGAALVVAAVVGAVRFSGQMSGGSAEATNATAQRPAGHTVNADAHEAYLKGRFFWNRRDKSGYQRAISQFEEAIRRDPGYAPAYSGLADALALYTNAEHLPRNEGYQRARQAALRAIALDGTLAEAHASLGYVLHKFEYDWEGAEREFRRAIDLNPQYATAHHWRAYNFEVLRRFEEGYAEIKEALALDPLSYSINFDFSTTLTMLGRCDEAVAQARKTVEMYGAPDDNGLVLGDILVRCAKYDEAIPLLEKVAELRGAYGVRNAGLLGYAYARADRAREARRMLEVLTHKPESSALLYRAEVQGALGEIDAAFQSLRQLYDSKDDRLLQLNAHQMLDPLRSDRRFQSLLQQMKLLPSAIDRVVALP